MKTYTVKYWNKDTAKDIEAESFNDAYIKFLEDNELHESPVVVSCENDSGGGFKSKTFNDHMEASLETTNEQFSAIEDKLDVLIGLVSHIRFAVVLAVVVWGVLMLAARLQ